jgi:hypothetical protein
MRKLHAQVARRCKKHILTDMKDVKSPICEDCNRRIVGGGFKMKGDKRVRWCVKCKPPGAVPGRASKDKINKAAS